MCYACIASCTVNANGQAQLTAKLVCFGVLWWELSTFQLGQCKQFSVIVKCCREQRWCLFLFCVCVCTASGPTWALRPA
jgi:hypothetical protein